MLHYTLNPDSDTPIYRQLVDQINAEIHSGALKTGTQLPTVREMADALHLSCGTVKRVYDRLRDMGDIEMTRRRGTFVKFVRDDGDSRKTAAMTAIDKMIRRLTDLHFSPAEIQIFLNLKMREWGLKWSGIRVVIVTSCDDISGSLERQVRALGNVHITTSGITQLREYPYSVDEQADVILASEEDEATLQSILPDKSKLIRVALCTRQESIREIMRRAGTKFGVLASDPELIRLLQHCFPGEDFKPYNPKEGSECLVVSENWRDLFDEKTCALIEAHADRVEFAYEMDAGSMLYLEERIGHIRETRKLQPGALTF